ncbi:MAG: DegT/DnrJ/EryC1/StrS aminotransferase family protein [Spirochaetales bacterium]|nr:DegT/DnrJ/EryC1/StrS aminotransferase family protein [Spirochaetales bacterium]
MSRNIDFIPFALPCLGKEEEEAVIKVMRSGWLTTGKETTAFEREFAEKVGSKHAIALNSATAGLHLSLETQDIPEDSWVITTPYTFTATAEIIRYKNAHPLFVDIDEISLNIDPFKIEDTIKRTGTEKNIRGIIPVHTGGHPCAMEEIMAIAGREELFVTEDAAHAFPSFFKGKAAGTWGNTGVYSFYATKTITTGEGGMVVTDDDEIADRIKCLRLHGIDREVWNRYQSKKLAPWEYDVVAAGYKYNPTDISSAMGRVQLKRAEAFLKERISIARFYLESFRNIPELILPAEAGGHTWHLFIIRLNLDRISCSRDEFMNFLSEEGIGTSVHYKPLHLMTYYKEKYNLSPEDFPVSTRIFNSCVSLPIYPGMTEEQKERVVRAVRTTIGASVKRSVTGVEYDS